MDKNGFEAVNAALAAANIDATVTPQPSEGEDVRFATIETATSVQPAKVLNALAMKNLVHYGGSRNTGLASGPELNPIGVQPGSITFEDKNGASPRMWG